MASGVNCVTNPGLSSNQQSKDPLAWVCTSPSGETKQTNKKSHLPLHGIKWENGHGCTGKPARVVHTHHVTETH